MSTRDPQQASSPISTTGTKTLSPSSVQYQSAKLRIDLPWKGVSKKLGKDTLGTATTLSAASWIQSSPQRVNLPDSTTELALMTVSQSEYDSQSDILILMFSID
ncbi:hypothetical protein PGTUg99_003537 [Puccinia graminis f. sp. tritici]|uniref:Uncharacterized protein n=1 Tax=Puccinia graminis f. sp. tritici TaxID=56615 RepID=A0A5B0P7U3_PUCGR|nr:hypothetical protein PGTUg99_003537 [Puccinia graminis f. sp. tritici]